MPNALKVKQFGLPRWVWLLAITGGVGVGLYIRSRRSDQAPTDTPPPDDTNPDVPDATPTEFADTIPSAAGADSAGGFDMAGFMEGLAALGVGLNQDGEVTDGNTVVKKKKKIAAPTHHRHKKHKHRPKKGGGPPKRPQPVVHKSLSKRGGHDHKPVAHPHHHRRRRRHR